MLPLTGRAAPMQRGYEGLYGQKAPTPRRRTETEEYDNLLADAGGQEDLLDQINELEDLI